MAPRTKDIAADKFPGGMDCRVGLLGSGLDRFRELSNCIISHDNSILLRMPCPKLNGALDTLCQGLLEENGTFYTVAQKGTTPANTGEVATLCTVLYFDRPENVTNTWVLVDLQVYQGQASAWIRHTTGYNGAMTRLFLHVWDALPNQPTYVSDPAAPSDWGLHGFPLWVYGSGTGIPGAWQDFQPAILPAVTKIWSPTVDNNDAFSAVGNGRVWNNTSADNIEQQGAMYYWIPQIGGVEGNYCLPELFSNFADCQRFAGWVLEGLNADGSWSKVPEYLTVADIPSNSDGYAIIGANGVGNGRLWANFTAAFIFYTLHTPYPLIRFRLLMTPQIAIVSGGVVNPPTETYTGDGITIAWPSTQSYASFVADGTTVSVNGNVKGPTYYQVTQTSSGLALVTFDNYHQVIVGTLALGAIVPGSGFTSLPSLSFSGGTGGTGGAPIIQSLKVVSVTSVAAGGTGYQVGDVLTGNGGVNTTPFQLTVTAVSAGPTNAVTAVSITVPGVYTTPDYSSANVTGGHGTGAQFNLSYGIGNVTITPGYGYATAPTVVISGGGLPQTAVSATVSAAGTGYTVGQTLTVVGGTGTPATFTVATVSGSTVLTVTLVSAGLYSVTPANPAATSDTGTGCTLTIAYATVGSGASIGLLLADPVGLTSIPYAIVGDVDFTGLSVYFGGIKKTLGTDYTITDVATFAQIVPGTALALGSSLDARMVVPSGTTIQFSSPTAVVGAAVVTYETVQQTTAELPLSALSPSTTYLIGVSANGSSNITPATQIVGAQPSTVGNGYKIGDVLTIVGGTFTTAATFSVTAISNGGIGTVALIQGGAYTAFPGLPAALCTVSGGSGTGAVLQVSYAGSWTGLQRYQIYIQAMIVTDAGGNITNTYPFQYGNLALTQFYVQRHQTNLDFWSGLNETGFLNTSTLNPYGGPIISQVAIKNRMLVCYQESVQLWNIDPNPANNEFLDQYAFGTTGQVVNFFSMAMVCTQMGFLNFDLQGINFQALIENNVGLSIQSLGQFTVQSAVFYPQRGAYLAAVTLVNAQKYANFVELTPESIFYQPTLQGFVWLTYTKESGITAWSFFTVAGLTNVTRMVAKDTKIYCLQGQEIWTFDDLATVFMDGAKDANGNGTVPYTGVADWALVPFNEGSSRMIHMDMVKSGVVSVSIATMPWNAGYEIMGPILRHTTWGRLRVPLRCTGRAIGARMITNDPTGCAIKSIRFEYVPLGR